MSKAPKMPKVPPEDGIERHKAYTRINPSGHKEFVADDDEETLNELSESLNECAEMMIWNYVRDNLSDEILNRPGTDEKIDDAIGRGEGPDTILAMFKESVAFGGPLAAGGGAGSPEQPQYDRRHNQFTPELVGSSGDQVRETGDDVNNLTSTTQQAADGPERSRAKSKIKTSTVRGIGPRNKYIAGHDGDGLDYGATHSESFTGTGAIAISPGGGYNLVDDDEDDEDQDPDETQTENNMTRQNDVLAENLDQLLNEWEPSFKGGEYSPGEYQMPSPTGDGVAERKPKKDKVGSFDTDTSQNGKEWPRSHKTTDAMQSVGDDGTDEGSSGYKESSHAEASDGHQTATGHNWPDEAKNSGGGVAEPFEGDRWSDGGTLKGGSGQDEMDNAGTAQKMPSSGPITGTSGPQLGQPNEGWNPRDIGVMMEGEFDLQSLFDSYARDYEMVCVEDFQALCNAHGCGATLDQASLLQLMEANQEFIFYHGEDANGAYWAPTPIAESGKPFPGAAEPFGSDDSDDSDSDDSDDSGSGKPWEDDSDDDAVAESKKPWEDDEDDEDCDTDCDAVAEGKKSLPFGRTISELQVRSAEREGTRGGEAPGSFPSPGPVSYQPPQSDFEGFPGDPDLDPNYDEMLGDAQAFDAQHGPGPMGGGCPECGAPDTGEAACAECGAEMGMGSEEEMFGDDGGRAAGPLGTPEDVDIEDEYFGDAAQENGGPSFPPAGPDAYAGPEAYAGPQDRARRGGFGENMVKNSPQIMESLHNFMLSARRILENNQEFSANHIGEALRYSWAYHARKVNPRTTPTKVRATLEGLAKRFPTFAMVMESGSDAMDSSSGTAIGTGGGGTSSSHLPKTDTEMKDEGEPLGASQENDLDGTPEMKGTAKGMDGKGSVPQAVKENVARLSSHVQRALKESAKSLRGKYDVKFAVIVSEGKGKNRTPIRTRLAEALADAEEILQFHKSKDVELEATFSDSTGQVVLKQDVPLLTIKPRGILATEGAALFRFQRNAERFADQLVAEGVTCRIVGHNWGRAVKAKASRAIAEGAFKALANKNVRNGSRRAVISNPASRTR